MFRVAPPRPLDRLLSAASALTTPLLPEDFLGLIDPLWSTTRLRGRVVARRRESERAVSVTIEPGRAWAGHRAGQFVRVGVDVDGVRHWRSYSLTGPETDRMLTITVQEVDGGVVSRKLVRDLPIGRIVELEQAAGEFLLPDPQPSPLLFLTAGSGITPVMGMLRTLDAAGSHPDVVLVHSAPTPEDAIFGRELDALADRWPGLRVIRRHTRADGRIGPADVDDLVPDRRDRLAYACGPSEMLDALSEHWAASGAPTEGRVPGRLLVERFEPPRRSSGGTGGAVVYGDRAVAVEPGASLLEAGEEAGVLMPSGCRMGICFGCVLPLRDGQVRDLRTGEVHGEPGDLVQTCISGASGDAVLDTTPGRTTDDRRPGDPVTDLGPEQQPLRPVLQLVPSSRREDVAATTSLTAEQIEELGRRLDAIRDRVLAERGESDAAYIRKVVDTQRYLEIGGRALLFAGVLPPAWIAGTAMLSIAKILENMEIGHNVMHGQWDWMRDPKIHSSTWEWDNASASEGWKFTHNYQHHTYTNVVGKDRDVGYGILRLSEEQPWKPYYLGNPVYNALLSLFFEYGVALHDLEVEKVVAGEKPVSTMWQQLKGIGRKVRRQVVKDYVAFPALAGPFFAPVLLGNLTANLVRNVWSHAVIFCGHFRPGAVQFSEEQLEDETRGEWYVRQLLGSANLDGGRLFHLMTGQLSFQIEHHLFPDLPSNRYAEIAPEVRELCDEYGLEYTSGPLWKQYLQVLNTINRLALPSGQR